MKTKYLLIPFTLGLGLALALLGVLVGRSAPAVAAPRVEPPPSAVEGHIEAPSALAAELHVCPSGCAYSSVQAAVDAANEGDVIKVAAGIYTDMHVRPRNDITTTGVVTQVVYISKTVTIQGGYTTTNWTTPDSDANLTTLDAQGRGRVLYITGPSSTSATIEGLRFTGGDADGLGGDLASSDADVGGGVYGITATVRFSHCQVSSNTADSGGGVCLHSDDIVLSGNAIFSNTAAQGFGGGVYIPWSENVTLSSNTIHSNEANGGGGIHLWYCNATVSGNVIHSNEANGGGGIYLWNGHGFDTVLSDNIIFGNTAQVGGGIDLWDSDHVTLNGNSIFSNTAQEYGGGIWLNFSIARLRDNTIRNNEAITGGGIYMRASFPTLTNNVIADNQASASGSGLYIAGSSPHLLHNTIARNNNGDGSGVYVTTYSAPPVMYSTVALTNALLVEQAVGISVTSGNTVTVNGILWHDTPITVSQATTAVVAVQNQHWGDPVFAPDGYHLTAGSAAIDKGVDAGVTVDIDGEPRPVGTGYDIGVDEYYYPALEVTKEASPDPVQPGGQLTYTIRVTNTGNVDLNAIVTDTLPTRITSGQTSGGTAIVPGGQITWTLVITAPSGVWAETVVVTMEEGYEGPLTNLVEVTTEEGAAGDARVTVNPYKIYLPLIMRNH